jgi:enoyl-CoA hydratase
VCAAIVGVVVVTTDVAYVIHKCCTSCALQVADMGTLQRLPRIVGDQRAAELTYTGRTFSGKEAQQMGLVLECFDTQEEMMAHVDKVAKQIASKSPLTTR